MAGVGGGNNSVGGSGIPDSVGLFGVVDIPWSVIAGVGELGWVAIRSGVDFSGDMGVGTGGGEMVSEGEIVGVNSGIVWLPFGIDRGNMADSRSFHTASGPTKPRQHNQ